MAPKHFSLSQKIWRRLFNWIKNLFPLGFQEILGVLLGLGFGWFFGKIAGSVHFVILSIRSCPFWIGLWIGNFKSDDTDKLTRK